MNGTLAPSISLVPHPHGKHMSKPSKTRKRSTGTAIAAPKPYVPTVAERGSLSKLIEQRARTPPHAGARVEVREGRTFLSWDHPNQAIAAVLWANALGTTDLTFAATIFEQLAQVARTGPTLTESEFNSMLSLGAVARHRPIPRKPAGHPNGCSALRGPGRRKTAGACRKHRAARQCLDHVQQIGADLRRASGGVEAISTSWRADDQSPARHGQ